MTNQPARVTALGLLCVWLLPCIARAGSGAAPALSWVRDPSADACIPGPELAAQLERQLGRSVLVPLPRSELTVEAAITAAGGGFAARFRVIDRAGVTRGERAFRAPVSDCRLLDPLLVFVLALLIDPDAPLLPPELPPGMSAATDRTLAELFGMEPSVPPLALAAPAPRAQATTPAEADLARKDQAPAKPAHDPPADDGWHMRVDADAELAFGLLPQPGLGARVTVGLSPAAFWRIEAGASAFAANTFANAEGSFSLFMGHAGLCSRVARFTQTLALWSCVRGSAGSLRATVQARRPLDPARPVLQVGADAALAWELAELVSLQVGVAALSPLWRERFYVNEGSHRELAFRMSALIPSALLGISAAIF